ncbi:hypothetical protein OEG84_00385 [Hoeflea sp. G2-23]|uniref:RiboL-PSP-HEPN domain-containing protein n=1 Tax=Hoeflea algicola TaxID=2983763 RepID=A0ABT3Z363_9HYPH|nr:hypothetical protein [Hoeflea algicola]MCY0146213.1 hypothetical protein [Hoeflea algicola]
MEARHLLAGFSFFFSAFALSDSRLGFGGVDNARRNAASRLSSVLLSSSFMELDTNMEEPLFPMLVWGDLNREQIEERAKLDRLISSAYREVDSFRSAIALADHSFSGISELSNKLRNTIENQTSKQIMAQMRVVNMWPVMAAHSAINSLYHFSDVLDGLAQWADGSSFTRHFANPDKPFTPATILFESNFPKWKQTRHAVAHKGEITRKMGANLHKAPINKGSLKKAKGATALIQDFFDDRTFITTRRGELLRFDVTAENYEKLLSVYKLVIQCAQPKNEQRPKD